MTETMSRLASGTEHQTDDERQAKRERTILSAIVKRPAWTMGRITDADGVHALLTDGDLTAKVSAFRDGWEWQLNQGDAPICDGNIPGGPTANMRAAERAIADHRVESTISTTEQMLRELSSYVSWHGLDVQSAGVGHDYLAGKFGMRVALSYRNDLPGLLDLVPTIDGPHLTVYLMDNDDEPRDMCIHLHGTRYNAPIEIAIYGLRRKGVADELLARIPDLQTAKTGEYLPVPFDVVQQLADEIRAAEAVQS